MWVFVLEDPTKTDLVLCVDDNDCVIAVIICGSELQIRNLELFWLSDRIRHSVRYFDSHLERLYGACNVETGQYNCTNLVQREGDAMVRKTGICFLVQIVCHESWTWARTPDVARGVTTRGRDMRRNWPSADLRDKRRIGNSAIWTIEDDGDEELRTFSFVA
jgi:hypothetical protein